MHRPTPIIAWAVALLMAGGWMASRVPMEWVPTVELPEVRISTAWPGNEPRAVERYVTAPIERAVQQVAGTAGVESVSETGWSLVVLQVADGVDLGSYVARVNEQLALLRGTLPDRVTPRLTKTIPEALRDEQGFMTIQLIGPQDPAALRRLAEEQVAPRLRSVGGIADVVVRGGTRREVLITLDPDRLDTYRVDPNTVRAAVQQAFRDRVYGRLRAQGRAPLLLSPSEEEVDALRTLVVRPSGGGEPMIHLRDVGRVVLGPAPRRTISRVDGDPVVTLSVDRAPASPMLEVAAAVRDRLHALRPVLPDETRLLVADDKSEDVRSQLRDLAWRGGLGLSLVVLVLLVLMRSVRAVGVVLFSVAVALAVALALMDPLGLTLNLLTLAGLVLVFGLLVDNSVVMVEQLIRQRTQYRPRKAQDMAGETQAASDALRAVWLPLVGGTLTTGAVMIPLVYLSGDLQALFLPFGVLTALTLGASLISAALLVPVLGRWLPPPESSARASRQPRAVLQIPYREMARFPKTTLLALILLLGTPLWLLPEDLSPPEDAAWSVPAQRLAKLYNATLGSDAVREARTWTDPALGGVVRPFIQNTFFGQSYDFQADPEVIVRLVVPPGTPIARTDSLLHIFERTALASTSIHRTLATVRQRFALLRVQFTEAALQTAEPYVVREKLIQRAVLLAGIEVSVSGLLPQGYYSGSGGSIAGLSAVAYGSNYDDLDALCEQFATRLKRTSRRVVAVHTTARRYGRREPREVLRFHVGPDAQAQSGISPQSLADRLRPVLSTRAPVLYAASLVGEPRLPVRIIVAGAEQMDIETLVDRPLLVGDSSQVKFKSVASYTVDEVPERIEREDQQYRRYLEVDFRGPHRMGHELLNEALATFSTPPGYRIERVQHGFFTERVQTAFGWVLLGTIGLVVVVTAIVFESWRLPWIVLLSVPMAAVGVAAGFMWTDVVFAEGAFIGMVLLVGIAANDALLLVYRYRQLRARHPHRHQRVLARLAVRERLRPMWTTTLSTCVAMLPLLVFPQDGDFWAGLAVTVTGGLLAATLLTPVASVSLISTGVGRNHTSAESWPTQR